MANKPPENNREPNEKGGVGNPNPHQARAPYVGQSQQDVDAPFTNEYGVVIGDSFYDSSNSPLNHWSEETDPAIMSGDQWVHPTNDIGWNTAENQELRQKGIVPQGGRFMHPTRDVGYRKD
ncbi:DUF3905 domain-containing protein [Aneurinibacillus terranovensis]|uniref:DUF3905 domain-containing protein n=1 Tax=Aneurinibacillus terranovensis TaxID=278991 RepID=UPI0004109DE5|nr:DUF3905 domain-containing protein [Aneurinibacillus terranovensis]